MTVVRKNKWNFLQEATGLAIFMISACLFAAILEGEGSVVKSFIPNSFFRLILMGLVMGITALFIFYSPFTAPSGSQINPAVTITFLRLGRMTIYDAIYYVMAQVLGSLVAVIVMRIVLGPILTHPPVNSAATVPGKFGITAAALTELIIAFLTMSIVLFISENRRWKKFTRIYTSLLVSLWVIMAAPISGFGMNPARSLASALPANTWTAFWIYILMPVAGMLLAAELYLYIQRKRKKSFSYKSVSRKRFLEPLEFVL